MSINARFEVTWCEDSYMLLSEGWEAYLKKKKKKKSSRYSQRPSLANSAEEKVNLIKEIVGSVTDSLLGQSVTVL